MVVLDTDHLTIIQQQHEPFYTQLKRRLESIAQTDLYITIASVHEQLLEANNFISQAKKRAEIVRGYRMIESAMSSYERFRSLPFAFARFRSMNRQFFGSRNCEGRAFALAQWICVSRRLLCLMVLPC